MILLSIIINSLFCGLTLADGTSSFGTSETNSNDPSAPDEYFDNTKKEVSASDSQEPKTSSPIADSGSSNTENQLGDSEIKDAATVKSSVAVQESDTAQQNLPTSEKKNSPNAQKGARASVSIATASSEQMAAAIGHYARARSLLIAAVREFDKGMSKADASPLLDTYVWRESMISHAAELERILSPKPRESKTGVQFEPDPRLLGEATK
jgi:hypothetical protein